MGVSDERRTDTTQGQMQSAPAGLDSYLAPAGIVARAKVCRCAARNILIGGISAGPVAIVNCAPQPQHSRSRRHNRVGYLWSASRTRPRNAKSKVDESAPQKVFTNDDAATLPPGAISIVGPPPPAPGAAKPKAKPADDTAKLAAYWKPRFTAARQKLAQDKNALPGMLAELKVESLQEIVLDSDTDQVYSDTYMDLVHQIDATKLAIQNDKQALSDLHEEFRHAGGLPGWIR